MSEWTDRWALVTGASSGLGADFARQLAEAGAKLVLVARREDRLKGLAEELAADHGAETRVVALDLGRPDAADVLHERLAADGIEVDVLVNNAGFGLHGDFLDIPWERERAMLELDVVSLTHLTKRFLHDMAARDRGWVLHVASVGAYQPSPTYATYSAAKAYVLSFSEAIAYELRHTKVKVTAVSPGVTRTEFLAVSGQRPSLYQRLMMMESPDVVRSALRALRRGRPSVIPGFANALAAFTLRFTPRRLMPVIAHRAMTTGQPSGG
jgi:short-subunit dehydrogenase